MTQMQNKYLILNFSSAKLFYNTYKTKDIITDFTQLTGRRKRDESYCFKEAITVYQVSNMLHVLFGQRPSATLRNTFIEKNDYLFEKANNSYLKLNSAFSFNKNKKTFELIKEKSTIKKAVYNSWNPSAYLNWEIIKNYTGNNYNNFIELLNNYFNFNVLNYDFQTIKLKVFENINDYNIICILNLLKDNNCTGLCDVFSVNDNKNNYLIIRKEKTALTVVNGVEDIANINGSLIIPINDSDIELINNFKGTCTILDGGLIYIDSVINDYDLTDELIKDYKLVKEISLDKIQYKKDEN